MRAMQPEISVVIPVYNEAPNLRALFSRVFKTLEVFGRTFEVVAVNDGSTDESLSILKELRASDLRLRIVNLARNFGQTPALYAGFAHVRGQIVVTLDADLQNPPEEVTKLINKLDEGYDFVQGWREKRRDSVLRRLPSRILNIFVSRILGARMQDLGCGFMAFRREVVNRLTQCTHHSRYVAAEVVWFGVRMAAVKVRHDERGSGRSKYGWLSLLWANFNLISSISTVPIKVVGGIGWALSLVGFAMGARILLLRLIYPDSNPYTRSFAVVIALLFFIAGIQLIAMGIVCEYVGRIFVEVQNRPYYVVKEVIE